MANIMGTTRGGSPWEPQFIVSIDQKLCIGCGRCYKTCARDVLSLTEHEIDDEDDDDYDDDDQMMVMSIKDALDCVGCEACSKVCAKKAISHAPMVAP